MKAKSTSNLLVILLIVIAASVGYMALSTKNTGTTANVFGQATPANPTGPYTPADPNLITDLSGTLSLSVQNAMDTTAKTYRAATVRVYKSETPNSLFGTVTTIATGTGRGTLTLDKFVPGTSTPQTYIYYVPAVDGGMTSMMGSFTAAENVEVNAKVANQSGLIFKVYDDEARGYLYESTEHTANVSAGATNYATGKTFMSTTSNTTGTAVGLGGYYDYTIYLSTNGTASTKSQFEDQQLLIAIDGQDLSDWNKPTLSIPGAVITELAPGSYSDKIKNDGYDWVYSVTGTDGKPLHVDSTWKKLTIQEYAKSGVNPSDNIKLGFYTAGYAVKTLEDSMLMSTHSDDSSQTAIYTTQDLTLDLS
jgi:hypothetical protein